AHSDRRWTRWGCGGAASVVHVKQRAHLKGFAQTHEVLIKSTVAVGCCDGSENPLPQVLNLIAFQHRCFRVKKEAPVRLVSPQEICAVLTVVIAKSDIGQPAMSGLMSQDVHCGVCSEKDCVRIVR